MDTIRIKHPTLDDGRREVEVPVESWVHYSAAGWQRTDVTAAEAPAEPAATEPETQPRRSRTTKEA